MGESKRRGTKEERVARALGSKQQKLSALIQKLGLPADAMFCGYLIQVKTREEFIQHIEDNEPATQRLCVKAPELALRFARFVDAYQLARADEGEIIVGLFDVGGQYLIHPVLGDQ